MKISIVTVCFNSAETIHDTLRSVAIQSFDDIELIVVDGGSTDETLSIVGEFGDLVSVLISEQDEGIYDAMNKGVQAASGDVVGILNSDDFFSSADSISRVAEAFERNPRADGVCADIVFIDSEDHDKVVRHYSAQNYRRWFLRFGVMPPHPGTYVRRQVYEDCGLYRTDFRIAADYEMFVRWLYTHNKRLVPFRGVLVRMRLGGASTSGLRAMFTVNSEILRACRANKLYTNWLLLFLKLPLRLFEFIRPAPKLD